MPNPQKTQGGMESVAATYQGPKPGDYPLGSPESRAAARAMLDQSRKLSPYDQDCLLISYSEQWLYGTCPSTHEVSDTPFFKRGFELEQILDGPIIPAHLNTKGQRQTQASMAFEGAHGREPVVGDILRYEDVERVVESRQYPFRFAAYEAAWKRRLPNLVFPLRFEDGRLFKRVKNDGRTITWEEDTYVQSRWRWYSIESEAVGGWDHAAKPPAPPAITAVVFVESPDARYAVKPLSSTTS